MTYRPPLSVKLLLGIWMVTYFVNASAQQADTVQLSTTQPGSAKIAVTQSDTTGLDSAKIATIQSDTTGLDSAKIAATQSDTTGLDSAKIAAIKSDTTELDSAKIAELDSIAKQEAIAREAARREKMRQDSITARISFVPTGIRFGTDLVSLIRMGIPDGFSGWEVSGDIDFNKLFLTGEFGNWEREITSETQNYSNKGYYFRVGVDVAFFSKQRRKNIFFVGARYGRSLFDEQLKYAFEDKSFGVIEKTVNSTSVEAHWMEVTTGFRLRVWKGLWIGYTVRMKIIPGIINPSNQMQPYDIPGYGLFRRIPSWGLNYQLYWRIGFRR